MLGLLRGGVEPSEILAITFTRKAAAEIRSRLLSWLEAESAKGEVWATALLHRLLLGKDAADRLHVHTFHSWFASLLDGRGWSASWLGPPQIVEAEGALREAAWLRWLEEHEESAALEVLLADYSPHTVRRLFVEQVAEKANAWRLCGERCPPEQDAEVLREDLREQLRAFVAEAKGTNRAVIRAAEAAVRYLERGDFAGLQEGFLTRAGGVRKNLEKAFLGGELAEAVGAMRVLAGVEETNRVIALNRLLTPLIDSYLRIMEEIKTERNVMSFNDLEWHTLRAVADEGGDVNAMLRRAFYRHRHVLIDECQDTSPLQWHIVREWLLAVHGSDAAPSVFVVGDPKQAIYRFRHGDARLLVDMERFLKTYYQGGVLRQTVSFRSSPVVLDVVNRIFGSRAFLADYETHSATEGNRDLAGRVEWHEFVSDGEGEEGKIGQNPRNPLKIPPKEGKSNNDLWADAIAHRIAAIVGRWRIREDGEERLLRYGDVLVLLPQTTHVGALTEAISRQNIPYHLQGGRYGLADIFACQDVLALVRALLSPENEYSLAQVLRSPLFACSTDCLSRLAAGPGYSLWMKLMGDGEEETRRARDCLSRWRAWLGDGRLPAYDLLVRVFEDGEVFARYRSAVQPSLRRHVTQALEALLDSSLQYAGGTQPLADQFLAQFADAGGETPLPPVADSVRIMTVHKAKGLEAPVVILADTGFHRRYSGGKGSSLDVLIDWPPESQRPRRFVVSPRSAVWAFSELREEEEGQQDLEYANLLYVALTRAKQGLLIFSRQATKSPLFEALRDGIGACTSVREGGGCRRGR